jgi:urease accessory protein
MASHSHDVGHSHSHDGGDHGHTHEILDGPGSYLGREMPIVEGRDFRDRAFTVGIGGCVMPVLHSREYNSRDKQIC